jgi:hypothetical protein
MAINPFIKKPNQAGTGFTNIQRMLQANRSNRLGQTVAGGVQKAGEAARGAISQAGQQFQQDVGKERQRQMGEEQRVQNVLSDVSKTTDDDVAAFEKIRNAQMLGPTGVKNAQEMRSKAEEAENLGEAGGSQGGRFGLLQRYIGGNRQYTGGQQRLDSLLLGQTGANQLRQAKKATAGLGQQAQKQDIAAQETGKLLQGEARGLGERTIKGLEQGVMSYDQAIANKLAEETKKRQDLVKSITTTPYDFNTATESKPIELDEDLYNKLNEASAGFLSEDQSVYNVDLSKYIDANLMNATKQAVQTEEDFKRAQALNRLSGGDITGDAKSALKSYIDQSQNVGAFYKDNPFKIDKLGDLGDAVAKAKQEYDTKKFNRETEIMNLTRALGIANPGEYFVSGGALADAFRQYQGQGGQLKGDLGSALAQDAARSDAGNIERLRSGTDYLKGMYGGLYDQIEDVTAKTGGRASELWKSLKNTEADKKALDPLYGRFRTLKKKPKT